MSARKYIRVNFYPPLERLQITRKEAIERLAYYEKTPGGQKAALHKFCVRTRLERLPGDVYDVKQFEAAQARDAAWAAQRKS